MPRIQDKYLAVLFYFHEETFQRLSKEMFYGQDLASRDLRVYMMPRHLKFYSAI